MKLLFNCSLFFFLASHCLCQQLDYSIIWHGDSIGYIKVSRTLTDSSEYHKFESESKFRVILSFTTGYISEVFFEDGALVKSQVLDTFDGDVRGSALVEWTENKYLMIIDGEEMTWETPVLATVGSLYYAEPEGLTQVFSERFGRYLKIEKESEGKYRLTKPDDRTNLYQYENGICTKVEVNNSLASFSFHLVKD